MQSLETALKTSKGPFEMAISHVVTVNLSGEVKAVWQPAIHVSYAVVTSSHSVLKYATTTTAVHCSMDLAVCSDLFLYLIKITWYKSDCID